MKINFFYKESWDSLIKTSYSDFSGPETVSLVTKDLFLVSQKMSIQGVQLCFLPIGSVKYAETSYDWFSWLCSQWEIWTEIIDLKQRLLTDVLVNSLNLPMIDNPFILWHYLKGAIRNIMQLSIISE